jgi:hypothetical protein
MAGVLSAEELKRIAEAKEFERMKEALDKQRRHDEEQRHLHDAFFEREMPPDVRDRLNRRVRTAAEQGRNELQVLTFPAAYCSDGGRAINNLEPGWPDTLQGVAKRAYDFFKAELEPHGYRLRAQILSYPGGNLGDVGIFLRW